MLRKKQPISKRHFNTLEKLRSSQLPKASLFVYLSFKPSSNSFLQTNQTPNRDIMSNKAKVIEASQRHPRPDNHVFQYGTAGVSTSNSPS
jgi:hypothetical protein